MGEKLSMKLLLFKKYIIAVVELWKLAKKSDYFRLRSDVQIFFNQPSIIPDNKKVQLFS